jgi:hypothetical protein
MLIEPVSCLPLDHAEVKIDFQEAPENDENSYCCSVPTKESMRFAARMFETTTALQ